MASSKLELPKNASQIVKRVLIDQFKQKWSQSMSQSSKGLNYRMLKGDHDMEITC